MNNKTAGALLFKGSDRFTGQIIDGHFQSSEGSDANQYADVDNSVTISLDFSKTGDILNGTMVRLVTLNGYSYTHTVTMDMIKQ